MFRDSFLQDGARVTDQDASALVMHRNMYAYPNARMEYSDTPTEFPLADGVWARPAPLTNDMTGYEHDEYHRALLTSPCKVANLLGTTSTIYWGFYTWNRKIAEIRAKRHLIGYRSVPGASADVLAEALANMDTTSNKGKALAALGGICQLSRMPFGSKVVTRRHPEDSGVWDTQLFTALPRLRWAARAAFLRLGEVADRRCQEAYQAWCELLSNIASQMNAGIEKGLPCHWEDTDGSRRRWRAVDVERAIFHFVHFEKKMRAGISKCARLQSLSCVMRNQAAATGEER